MRFLKVIILIVFITNSYAQPSKDLIQSFEFELEKFNNNLETFDKYYSRGYHDFAIALQRGPLVIMGSKRSYPSLIPGQFGELLSFTNKGVGLVSSLFPQAKLVLSVTSIFTGMLEKGWKAHIADLEAERKKMMINDRINALEWLQKNKDGFTKMMEPFLKRASDPSQFEKKISEEFYKSNKKDAEQHWNELTEFNEAFNKIIPKTELRATRKLYEYYISNFLSIYNDGRPIGDQGSLIGFLELDDKFNIKNKAIVANVPAGYEVSNRLNHLLSTENIKPLNLDTYKILYINSPYFNYVSNRWERNVWTIALWRNNYIPFPLKDNLYFTDELPEMVGNERQTYQQDTGDRHTLIFLKKYGVYDKEIDKWKVKDSLFDAFTKEIPKGLKLPKRLREMYP